MMKKMRKVDFFTGKREFSDRVCEFMRCQVWKKAIELEFKKKIDDTKSIIEKLEKLDGSILAAQAEATKIAGLAQIAEYEAQRDAQIKAETKFALTDADKAFKKALRSADGSADLIAEAVVDFFRIQGLEVEDTYFLMEVLDSFGYKPDLKTLVVTDGQETLVLDVNTALKNVYAETYKHMLRVGAIKATQIPEIVREKYVPKTDKKIKKVK